MTSEGLFENRIGILQNAATHPASYAGLTRVSITLRKSLSKEMDGRVKPGHDELRDAPKQSQCLRSELLRASKDGSTLKPILRDAAKRPLLIETRYAR